MAVKTKKTAAGKTVSKSAAGSKKSADKAAQVKKTSAPVKKAAPAKKAASAKKPAPAKKAAPAKKPAPAPAKKAAQVKKTSAPVKKAAPAKNAAPAKKPAPAPAKKAAPANKPAPAPVKKAAPAKKPAPAPVKKAAPAPAKKPAAAKPAAKTQTKVRKDEILKKLHLSKADKKFYRELLLRARSAFGAQVQYHSDDALTRRDAAGERAGMATHMADLGTDNYRRDLQLGLLSDGADVLEMIDEALQRLEDSEYGICLDCGEPIPRKRLEAKPYAKYCTKCKSKREAMDETFYHRR